ncbi:hypothetical protein DM860_011809 [Cuscuta australis]|uniref:RRM domain-containing protein n=1 Tax=Cuscuta australis TaxID=267555 RepID=A0A328DF72_9ASTE|nr:hypothetical protein DM860_011809 [Cuscuta australis]
MFCKGQTIIGVTIFRHGRSGFLTFGKDEETSNAIALDGVRFRGVDLRLTRSYFESSVFAPLFGRHKPNPSLKVCAVDYVRMVAQREAM